MYVKSSKMRAFDIEMSLPKPEISRPRIDESYGMMQLSFRFLALLSDIAVLVYFIYVGVKWDYVNQFSTTAAAFSLIADLSETIALCNTSRRIKRIPVVIIMVMDILTLLLLGGSWFWYLYGQAKEGHQYGDSVLHHGAEDPDHGYREGCLYVSFVLFALHVINFAICWVDLCRRGV